jgi:hypothetical protein
MYFAQLGHPVTRSVRVSFVDNAHWGEGLAFTNYDATGVHVIWDLPFTPYFMGIAPPIDDLRVQSAPVALGAVEVGGLANGGGIAPIWIEATGSGVPKMYIAIPATSGPPETHEIPYPFSDGTAPSLVVSTEMYSVMVIDQSSVPPNDLLVASVILRSPTDVVTTTLRLPAPGHVRGPPVTANGSTDNVTPDVRQVVQFFDDTHTFVVIEERQPHGDPLANSASYQLSEAVRGAWPFRVVDGVDWQEGCNDSGMFINPPEYRFPLPLALLTDTGDIYVWQFTGGVEGESGLVPFGHVAPGTRWIWRGGGGVWASLEAVEPDGQMVVLNDSDCQDLRSAALRAQRFPAVAPWATSTEVVGVSSFGFRGGLITDGAIWGGTWGGHTY